MTPPLEANPFTARVGLGTYLADSKHYGKDETAAAIDTYLALRGTIVDTAACYGWGEAEKLIGAALHRHADRRPFLSTKVGYVPMSGALPGESECEWITRRLTDICGLADLVDGRHLIHPRYVEWQVRESLVAFGLSTVDVLYLHNPEHRLLERSAVELYDEITLAFAACERLVEAGSLRSYGCATWDAFRVPPGHPRHLSLAKLEAIAATVAGRQHHFRWIQLPINLAMTEAWLSSTQELAGERTTALQAAARLGLQVQASSPIASGRLRSGLPAALRAAFPGSTSDGQRCLHFLLSIPGIHSVLCGMSTPRHVRENLEVMKLPAVDPAALAPVLAPAGPIRITSSAGPA
jgi:aryl-alcohol dehydrogenase-like predicted oxidoreductase